MCDLKRDPNLENYPDPKSREARQDAAAEETKVGESVELRGLRG